MPEAVALELVVAHLDHELRLDRVPVELLALRPAALAARDALVAQVASALELRQRFLELAPDVSREARAVADEVELAVVAVETEQQRRDPALTLVAPAEADDHAVGGAIRLHLDYAFAGTRQVGLLEPLCDDPVEAGLVEPLEPALRLLGVELGGREAEALRLALELTTPLGQRQLVQRLALPDEDVEGDELGRDLRREPLDPALRRVEAHLELVELEPAVARDDDLAVEGGLRRQELADRFELWEVAQERPPVPAPQAQATAEVLEHPAEAVPLRLVLPVAGWQLSDELGFHRRERECFGRHGRNATGTAARSKLSA